MRTIANSFVILALITLGCIKGEDSPVDEGCVIAEDIITTDIEFLNYYFFKEQNTTGEAEGIKIDTTWKASVVLSELPSISGYEIGFITYRDTNPAVTAELLAIKFLDLEEGCYEVLSDGSSLASTDNLFASSYFLSLDQDVALDSYEVDESHLNMMEITQVDLNKRVISGKFAISFIARDGRTNYNWNPRTLRVYNCFFESRIP